MKYLKVINILPLSFLMFTLLALPAMADTYNVDGYISDWGVDLQKAYSGNYNGWIPTGHNGVDFIVENNIDPRYNLSNTPSGKFAWAGSSTGAHMQRNGVNIISDYEEPLYNYGSTPYVHPSGGEPYDIEALYFDDDAQNIYIAIVTSIAPGPNSILGDIALNVDDNSKTGELGYEYGVKTSGTRGLIIHNPDWGNTSYFPDSDPYKFPESSGQPAGNGTFRCERVSGALEVVINDNDQNRINYVYEASIPKSAIGYPKVGDESGIHITINCGNDEIDLNPVRYDTNIPEFPSIALPVAAIMGIMIIFGRRNKE